MKHFTHITKALLAAGILLSASFLQSCNKDNDYEPSFYRANAIVTVKPIDDKSTYFQLDDNTKLWPVNNQLFFKGKEVRALVNIAEAEMPEGVDPEIYDRAVTVNAIDSILTKKTVVTGGEDSDIEEYGDDPVMVINDWMTVVEDGYLTLHYTTYWGNYGIKHFVNIVTGTNPDDPYEIVFRHNAYDDPKMFQGDSVVAFSLADLPDTEGKTVKLTLKYDSFSGTETMVFDYCT